MKDTKNFSHCSPSAGVKKITITNIALFLSDETLVLKSQNIISILLRAEKKKNKDQYKKLILLDMDFICSQ